MNVQQKQLKQFQPKQPRLSNLYLPTSSKTIDNKRGDDTITFFCDLTQNSFLKRIPKRLYWAAREQVATALANILNMTSTELSCVIEKRGCFVVCSLNKYSEWIAHCYKNFHNPMLYAGDVGTIYNAVYPVVCHNKWCVCIHSMNQITIKEGKIVV